MSKQSKKKQHEANKRKATLEANTTLSKSEAKIVPVVKTVATEVAKSTQVSAKTDKKVEVKVIDTKIDPKTPADKPVGKKEAEAEAKGEAKSSIAPKGRKLTGQAKVKHEKKEAKKAKALAALVKSGEEKKALENKKAGKTGKIKNSNKLNAVKTSTSKVDKKTTKTTSVDTSKETKTKEVVKAVKDTVTSNASKLVLPPTKKESKEVPVVVVDSVSSDEETETVVVEETKEVAVVETKIDTKEVETVDESPESPVTLETTTRRNSDREYIPTKQVHTVDGTKFNLFLCNGFNADGSIIKVMSKRTMQEFKKHNGSPKDAIKADVGNATDIMNQLCDLANNKKHSINKRIGTLLPTFIGMVGSKVVCWDSNKEFKKGERDGHIIGTLTGFIGGKRNFIVDVDLTDSNDAAVIVERAVGHVQLLNPTVDTSSEKRIEAKDVEVQAKKDLMLLGDKRLENIKHPKGYDESMEKDAIIFLLSWSGLTGKTCFHSSIFKEVDGTLRFEWKALDEKGQLKTAYLPMCGSQQELIRATVLTLQDEVDNVEVKAFTEEEHSNYLEYIDFFFDLSELNIKTISSLATGETHDKKNGQQSA